MNHGKLSASFWLPLISLAVWFVLLLLPAGRLFALMTSAAHGAAEAHLSSGAYTMTVKREAFLTRSFDLAAFGAQQKVRAIYFPGYFIALLLWPHDHFYAHDRMFAYETYQAVAGPWLCLWFWWLVGACWESLRRKRWVRWGNLLIGTILCLLFVLLAIVICVVMTAEERVGMSDGVLVGLVLWAALFALAPATWFQQRRGRRIAPR